MNTDNARHVTQRLQAYVDGELPRDEADRITAHLRGCPSCHAVLDELETVARSLRSEADPEPLRPMWPAVRERLRGPAPAPRHRAAFAMATSAAAVLGLALGLFLGLAREQAPSAVSGGAWTGIATTLTGNETESLSDVYLAVAPNEGGP